MSQLSKSGTEQARRTRGPAGLTIFETLAIVTILGLLATLSLIGYSATLQRSRRNACHLNQGDIEVQVQRWRRDHGGYPQANLSPMANDPAYFPEGIPTCPYDGAPYTIDPTSGHVIGHSHE